MKATLLAQMQSTIMKRFLKQANLDIYNDKDHKVQYEAHRKLYFQLGNCYQSSSF